MMSKIKPIPTVYYAIYCLVCLMGGFLSQQIITIFTSSIFVMLLAALVVAMFIVMGWNAFVDRWFDKQLE